MQVQIGGEPQTIGEFSAYKAFKAMAILASVETAWREVLKASATFKREYEAENFVELDRAEARRQFRPRPLERVRREEQDDGRIALIDEPVLDEQQRPIVGPDPLGHLTEEDWQAAGNKLRIAESPSERMQIAAMIPRAFELGRDAVLQLLALVVVSNADLERWDTEGTVDDELTKRAAELHHRAKLDELVDLATTALELCRDQVATPFDRLAEAARTTFRSTAPETPAAKTPEPMKIEEEASSEHSPPSSTEFPDASDGSPPSSSTEAASDSSTSYANA